MLDSGKFAVTSPSDLTGPGTQESWQAKAYPQPALIAAFGLTLTQAGLLGGVLSFSSSTLQPVYGFLADRFHSRLFTVLAPAVAGTFISTLGFAGGSGWPALFCLALATWGLPGTWVVAAPAQSGTVSALKMGFAWGTAGLIFILLTGRIAGLPR